MGDRLVIEVRQAGEGRPGEWCPDCLLPSGVAVDIEFVDPDGHVGMRCTAVVCTDCDETWAAPSPHSEASTG